MGLAAVLSFFYETFTPNQKLKHCNVNHYQPLKKTKQAVGMGWVASNNLKSCSSDGGVKVYGLWVLYEK